MALEELGQRPMNWDDLTWWTQDELWGTKTKRQYYCLFVLDKTKFNAYLSQTRQYLTPISLKQDKNMGKIKGFRRLPDESNELR